jgi:hypothetical protein
VETANIVTLWWYAGLAHTSASQLLLGWRERSAIYRLTSVLVFLQLFVPVISQKTNGFEYVCVLCFTHILRVYWLYSTGICILLVKIILFISFGSVIILWCIFIKFTPRTKQRAVITVRSIENTFPEKTCKFYLVLGLSRSHRKLYC